MMSGCGDKNQDENLPLNLLAQYPVDIPGISDLSLYKNDEFLTVSDTLGKIFVISITGDVIKSLNYSGEDLEGITFDLFDSSIFVVEEKNKEIVKLDINGNEFYRFPFEVNNIFEKHGPEGISFNPVNDHLFVVNEKYPSLLVDMTLYGEVVDTNRLTFAKDYSAVFYDPLDGSLWILSEESEILAKCDLSGNPVKRYITGIKKAEGLIVASGVSRIYITSEQTNTLYVFSY